MKNVYIPRSVQNGAAILDKHFPDWFEGIDISKLSLSSNTHCILGQLDSHVDLMPEKLRKAYNRLPSRYESQAPFIRVMTALEKFAGVISLQGDGFIEDLIIDYKIGAGPYVRYVNREAWARLIEDRKIMRQRDIEMADLELQARLNSTPLAIEVRSAIDAEVEKIRADRLMDQHLRALLDSMTPELIGVS